MICGAKGFGGLVHPEARVLNRSPAAEKDAGIVVEREREQAKC